MTAPVSPPADVLAVCPLLALQRDGDRWVDQGIAVVRRGGRLYAFAEACPHGGASLADGEIRRGAVSCPRHAARFRLRDGKSLSGPARRPLACYDLEEAGSGLLVRPRAAAPAERGLRGWWRTLVGTRTAGRRGR